MAARGRDVAVVVVLVAGVLLAVLAWHPLGRWFALAVLLAAGLVAATVYRLRPSAVPWRNGPRRDEAAPAGAVRDEDGAGARRPQ